MKSGTYKPKLSGTLALSGTSADSAVHRQQAATPKALFLVLNREYSFNLDVCALEWNAKLPNFYTPEQDGLKKSWDGKRIWCNPPYDDIPPWLAKCVEAELAAYLLPARTDREWWRKWKPQAECHYFVGEKPHGRIQFDAPPGVKYSSNTGCNVLFLIGKGAAPGKEVWRSGRTGERL